VHGTVTRIIDADTFVLNLDLGWRVWFLDEHVRIAGINAPELSTPEGVEAKTWAEGLVPVGTSVIVTSHMLDKYGRALCALTLPDGSDYGEQALKTGHAVEFMVGR
jgi:endonuclease YncB( thermonuclease family)